MITSGDLFENVNVIIKTFNVSYFFQCLISKRIIDSKCFDNNYSVIYNIVVYKGQVIKKQIEKQNKR